MRFIISLFWALLIGGALAYVLSSMAGDAFNVTQSIVYSGVVFIAIMLMDLALKTPMGEE